jgi:hypothetical protein
MKILILTILILASFSGLTQVIKGGIPPGQEHGITEENKKDGPRKGDVKSGGGNLLDAVRDVEKKIKTFNIKLQKRLKKCSDIKLEFKNFSESMAYLNLKLNLSSVEVTNQTNCQDPKLSQCLLNKRMIKLLGTIGEHKGLETFLIHHENLSEEDFKQLQINLKKISGTK